MRGREGAREENNKLTLTLTHIHIYRSNLSVTVILSERQRVSNKRFLPLVSGFSLTRVNNTYKLYKIGEKSDTSTARRGEVRRG